MINCLIRGDEESDADEPDVTFNNKEDDRYLVTRMATPLYDQDRQMIGCLTILQDHSPIADLINRIQYEERSMKIVLDNLDVGIFTVNRGGLITFFNKAAEKISGYKKNEIPVNPVRPFSRRTTPVIFACSKIPSPMERHVTRPTERCLPPMASPFRFGPVTWRCEMKKERLSEGLPLFMI